MDNNYIAAAMFQILILSMGCHNTLFEKLKIAHEIFYNIISIPVDVFQTTFKFYINTNARKYN